MNPSVPSVSGEWLLMLFSIVGTAVFAASGALIAAQLRQTLVTFAFFALVTGVGGGTLRDLLIGAPVFWVHEPPFAMVCMGAAIFVWMTPARWWRPRALEWLDAVGLAAFAVLGTAKAMDHGIEAAIAVLMGIVTACVGGILRDVLAGQPSILLRPEVYVTAAALSAGLYALLLTGGVAPLLSGSIAATAGFALRALAMVKGLGLPGYSRRR